jgi:hypothetical protein
MVVLIHAIFKTWLLAARPDLPPLPSPAGGGDWGEEGEGGGQAGQPATMY